MLEIDPLLFLFLIQGLLILSGALILLFRTYRKLVVKEAIARGEAGRLQSELASRDEGLQVKNEELMQWQEMFTDLQKKVESMKDANTKLKDTVDRLVPEAEKSKEYEEVISSIEQSNKELDSCIGTLKQENDNLSRKTHSFEGEIHKLSRKLELSVSKEEYDTVVSQKRSVELKVNRLEEELAQLTTSYENLEKNYMWLEKEYNALYNNIEYEKGVKNAG